MKRLRDMGKHHCTQYYVLLLLIYEQQKLSTAIILGIQRFLICS